MATLTIPEKYRLGVVDLLRLDSAAVESIVSALQASRSTRARDLLERDEVSELRMPKKEAVLRALISLYFAKDETPVETFSRDLVGAASSLEGGPSGEQEIREAEQKLARLLSVDAFARLVKAKDLRAEFERTFCEARILTDFRPLFERDATKGATRGTIVHNLRIDYHDADSALRSIFIALTDADLASFRATIDRACAKGISLQERIISVGFEVLQ